MVVQLWHSDRFLFPLSQNIFDIANMYVLERHKHCRAVPHSPPCKEHIAWMPSRAYLDVTPKKKYEPQEFSEIWLLTAVVTPVIILERCKPELLVLKC